MRSKEARMNAPATSPVMKGYRTMRTLHWSSTSFGYMKPSTGICTEPPYRTYFISRLISQNHPYRCKKPLPPSPYKVSELAPYGSSGTHESDRWDSSDRQADVRRWDRPRSTQWLIPW